MVNSWYTTSGEGTDHDPGLRSARPPADFAPVRRWPLDGTADLQALRDGLRQEIDARAPTREDRLLAGVTRKVVLVACELATNALRHGRPPTVVELHQHGARFLLTVTDQDPAGEPCVAGDRPPGEGGYGLHIAALLSDDLGWYRADRAKVVWAELVP